MGCISLPSQLRSIVYQEGLAKKHTNYLALGGFVKKSRILMIISKPPCQDLDFLMVKLPESATKMVMVGSCNGLICLVNVMKQDAMIWNPITKEKKLIRLPPSAHSSSQVGYGIGHDFRYDYKIVRLVYLSTFPFESLVQVFSVNSNSWNDCGIVPFYPDAPNSCFNIGGVPYWVGLCEGGLKRIICSFDLNSERYVQYDFPSGTGTSLVNIVNIKDNLSAVVHHAHGFVEIYTFDTPTSTWVKGIKTGPLDIWFEVRRLHIFKDSSATMALGWKGTKGTEMMFHNNSDNSTLPHRGIGTGSFNPDLIGPFPHTIALARIQPKPENEKVEAQPLLHPKLVCGTIRNCCLEAENELEISLPTLLLPVAGKKVSVRNCCLEAENELENSIPTSLLPVAEKKVSGTVRNCSMESENELENLLTTLLLPVAGKKVYSEEDTSRMPLELGSALLIEREPVDDPEIRIEALEAIYLIALQERGRRVLWSVNGQRILQVGAEYEQNPKVIEAYERVGSLLLQGSDIDDTSTKAS